MLVIHVHILGEKGNVERTYDFLHNDNKEELAGCDVTIPYNKEYNYPITEREAQAIIRNKDFKGDH